MVVIVVIVVIVMIMIMMFIMISNTQGNYNNSLRTQATSKLTSPSAVQFVQGYRLEYVCCGFGQAQTGWWSAVRLVRPNI